MRLLLAICGMILLFSLSACIATAAPGAPTVFCNSWLPVNDGAFGMGTGGDSSYASEEGFEVLTFKDRLYVGMEADNIYGARLWRTRPAGLSPTGQADWEEVIADGSGKPFGVANVTQNDHVDSLAAFDGYLYVSTANGGSSTYGTQVWRSPTGDAGTWSPITTDGFGSVQNTNFKDMQVFQGWLCGGTQNWETGAQVWCTADGTDWVQKNHGGFGASTDITTTVEVWSGYVYSDTLYFGAQGSSNDARLFRTTDLAGMPTWTEVYSGTAGSYRADILGDLDGYLYIATPSGGGIRILRSATGDPGTWVQVNATGMDGDPGNSGSVVDGAAVYDGALYVGVTNTASGVEVWRTTGALQEGGPLVDWVQVGGDGLGDANNYYTELIPFNGDLYAWTSNYVSGQRVLRCPMARNIILLIGDGMGTNHIAAANAYYGTTPVYQGWPRTWAGTFSITGSYSPTLAWNDASFTDTLTYLTGSATDSAAAATALYSGAKTGNGRISVSSDGSTRLATLADKARAQGRAVGAVSTVQISHATPGAWIAHNDSRANGYAIADEGLWGDPNTTGSGGLYAGGHGPSLPPVDVLIGGGHPSWNSGYVTTTQRDKLAAENGLPGAFTFVERLRGRADGGARLLAAANTVTVTQLAGLFGGSGGNIEYRLADGSGHDAENPTLAQMTTAALKVLARDPNGFVLMVEGGAIDWAAHANNMNQMIGEVGGFNAAVQAVIDRVDAPGDDIDWNNTLVIVTADHETGYLTAGPGVFPDQPLGTINTDTLAKEKLVLNQDGTSTGRRASWEDSDGDGKIDPGETVYWAWNSGGHSNSLVPVYAKGAGASSLARYATLTDTVRGPYLDDTNIFQVMDAVALPYPPAVPPDPPLSPGATITTSGSNVVITWQQTDGSTSAQVWRSASPYLNPGDPGAIAISAPTTVYTDTEALAPGTAFFYTVRAASDAGFSATSRRVGVFSFALQPGE